MTRRYTNGATDIGGVIAFSQKLIAEAPFEGLRQVIDIAGDGTNNVNFSPHIERDRVVRAGTAPSSISRTAIRAIPM